MNARTALKTVMFPSICVGFLMAFSSPGLASAQGRITYEAHAERLDKLLVALSKVTHEDLRGGTELAGEIVAVAVHAVSVDELKKKLAFVTYGHWEIEGRTSYLVRPSLPSRDPVKELAERKLNVQRGLYMQWPVAAPNPGGVHTEDWGSTPDGRRKDRYEIELYELLQLIGEDAIASVGPNHTLRYSTDPNSGYLPLPKLVVDLLQFVVDQEPRPTISTGRAVANVEVTLVYEHSWIESVNAFVMATDANNERVFAICMPIVLEHSEPKPWSPARPSPRITLGLSQRTKDLLRTLDLLDRYDSPVPYYESREDKAVVARTLTNLKHPDQFDPLWCASDLLIATAKKGAQQFVGCLPDSMCDCFLGKESLGSIDSTIASSSSILSVLDSQWFSVRPTHPEEARTDRGLLADLGKAIANNEPYDLARQVRLLDRGLNSSTWQGFDSSGRTEGPVKLWLKFQHEPHRWNLSKVDGQAASFIAHLPTPELETLMRGGKLALADMAGDKVTQLLSILSDASPFWSVPKDSSPFLTLKVEKEPFFLKIEGEHYDVMSGVEERYIWGDIHNLANIFFSPRTKVQIGTREHYSLELRDAKRLIAVTYFELVNIDTNSKPLSPSEFPPEVSLQLAAEKERIKRASEIRPAPQR